MTRVTPTLTNRLITDRMRVTTMYFVYVIGYAHSRDDTAHAAPGGSDLALCGTLVTKIGGPWPATESGWLDQAPRCADCVRRTYGRPPRQRNADTESPHDVTP